VTKVAEEFSSAVCLRFLWPLKNISNQVLLYIFALDTLLFLTKKTSSLYGIATRFFSETKKLTVGKILDLYTINRALSNAPLKCSSYSRSFSVFFKPYNTSAVHSYLYIYIRITIYRDGKRKQRMKKKRGIEI
jgi:hypothetical protein